MTVVYGLFYNVHFTHHSDNNLCSLLTNFATFPLFFFMAGHRILYTGWRTRGGFPGRWFLQYLLHDAEASAEVAFCSRNYHSLTFYRKYLPTCFVRRENIVFGGMSIRGHYNPSQTPCGRLWSSSNTVLQMVGTIECK